MVAAIADLLGSYLCGRLTDHWGAKRCSLIITLANVSVLVTLTQIHATTPIVILMVLLSWFGLSSVFYKTSCTAMIMTWAKRGEEGKLSAIRLLLPVLGGAIGISGFTLFFDNTTVPSIAKSAEILGYFRHAIWFGLAIVALQIICTFWATTSPFRPVTSSNALKEVDSFLDDDFWKSFPSLPSSSNDENHNDKWSEIENVPK
jgi:MFS family permease